MKARAIAGLAAALAMASGYALAQAPQRTTATYGDWTLRCELQAGNPPRKLCEMVQTASAQGHANPISQVAIGRASKTEPMRMVFQLPINIFIPAGLNFVPEEKAPGVTAAFKRCVPIGCFAELDLSEDMIKRLRALNGRGRYQFKDAAQRVVTIPISFNGFSLAYDALLKQ